jgi:hypothetical protein
MAKASRYGSAPYRVLHTHLRTLLTEAVPGGNDYYLADALLAPLSAMLVLHHLRDREMSLEELSEGWCSLAAGLLLCGVEPRP